MAIIKAYTNIVQSRKLAEILSHESADMYYKDISLASFNNEVPKFAPTGTGSDWGFPCWSLAALLGVIPYNVSFNNAVYRFKLVKFSTHWECYHENFGSVSTGIFKADNPIDACYELILKLHERKML